MTKKGPRSPMLLLRSKQARGAFFAPHVPSDPSFVLRLVTYTTLGLCLLLILVLLYSLFADGHTYVLGRLYVSAVPLTYIAVTAALVRKGYLRAGSYMITAFYFALGVVMMVVWGISMAIGLLLFGFVIMLAGVTLGARRIIPVTLLVVVTMAVVQGMEYAGVIAPVRDILSLPTSFVDVVSFGVIFTVFAVVSWLSGRRMELALAHALAAEQALQAEKDLLAVRLEAKTREVREAQIEEMRGLYRFAELGQLGTALLHDLANNLTALTLDIDDIEQRNERSQSVTRARQSIDYLENITREVRRRIHIGDDPQVFDAARTVFDTVTELGAKARRAGVTIQYERGYKQPFAINGDPLRLAQALTIVMTNAIEAYAGNVKGDEVPSVRVAIATKGKKLLITVTDHGSGIPAARRENLFRPFSSTKENGMGIGLFMAREMIERHCGGTLTLESDVSATTFAFTLNPLPAGRKT